MNLASGWEQLTALCIRSSVQTTMSALILGSAYFDFHCETALIARFDSEIRHNINLRPILNLISNSGPKIDIKPLYRYMYLKSGLDKIF